MAFFNYGIKDYESALSVNKNLVCRVPGATAVEANNNEEKQYNISFIGNPFFKSDNLIALLNKHPELINANQKSIENFIQNNDNVLKEHKVKNHELKFHKTADQRTQLILQLLELEPKIFGPTEWLKLGCFSSGLIDAYDPRKVYSLAHNEKIYNRSFVSINTNHTQNSLGYPWRVHDIMGSSSVLLSEYREELVSDFADIVNLQLFHSPAEASELAKTLLNDEPLRLSIVAQQQEAINSSYRWKHRLPIIQQLTGVNLESTSDKIGVYELYRTKTRLPISENKKPFLKKVKKCIKKTLAEKKPLMKDSIIEYS